MSTSAPTPNRTILAAGDVAPDFTLTDQYGKERSLSDYSGRRLAIFFYPAANTVGCTKQACDFRDSLPALQAAGIDVVGISKDETEAIARFTENQSLTYPLLSDPSLTVHHAYGAFGDKNSYGKIIQAVIRSTFIIDAEGRIEHALYNVRATGHVARLRKLLGLDAS